VKHNLYFKIAVIRVLTGYRPDRLWTYESPPQPDNSRVHTTSGTLSIHVILQLLMGKL